jgi:hypothetical protein
MPDTGTNACLDTKREVSLERTKKLKLTNPASTGGAVRCVLAGYLHTKLVLIISSPGFRSQV